MTDNQKPEQPVSDRLAEEARRDLESALAFGRMWGGLMDSIFSRTQPLEDKGADE